MSRLRSAKEQRQTARDFAEGKVDILIGTHRLLSRDVQPKDLGLVIVDEEQRFGVKQKEALRQLRLNVDVLALSATPIPRTLQMSLAGLRDISVIETPPEGRRPIHTYVGAHDEDLVKGAIERELERGGQVFYLHDRVEDIEEAAERLRGLVPRREVVVAHGQMEAAALEEAMMGFLRGDTHVLVSTTIIESGLDIPQANTLIVERADRLGLAQLYQIRGRVGRSRERAYAYLLYPSDEALSHEAAARLSTLSDYTELGSGFRIAMRDLEIRGAGNLLGAEQSGHVAAVGFELYLQMLDEAVAARSDGETGGEPEATAAGSRSGSRSRSTPTSRPPTSPSRSRRSTSTAGSRRPASPPIWRRSRRSWRTASARRRRRSRTCCASSEARIRLAPAGARVADVRGELITISPLVLDSAAAKALREDLGQVLYKSLEKTLQVRIPEDELGRLAGAAAGCRGALAAARARRTLRRTA